MDGGPFNPIGATHMPESGTKSLQPAPRADQTSNPNAHVRLHVCGEHHDDRSPCRPTSDLLKVRRDLHDTNRALSEWWRCDDVESQFGVLHAALEALLRAVSTLTNVVEAQATADPGEMANQPEAFAGKTIDAWLT